MNFATSTHKSRWIFNANDLKSIRSKLLEEYATGNEKSIAIVENTNPEDSSSILNNGAKRHRGSAVDEAPNLQPPISLEEQQLLLYFFETKANEICNLFKMPRKVKATTLTYFKRVYLKHCCLDADPMRTMLTCIYLAAKVEESYISAHEFCRHARQDASIVLKSEINILQALQFDLVVHSPYRALAGILQVVEAAKERASSSPHADLQIDEALCSASQETLMQCRASAIVALDMLMLTDAPLLFGPSQMALAAFRSGCNKRGIKIQKLVAFMARQAATQAELEGSEESIDVDPTPSLHATLSSIDQLGVSSAAKQIDPQAQKLQVADIDRRIKLWKAKDPAGEGRSDAHKQAQAAGEKEKAARRESKLRARQESKAAEEARLLGIVTESDNKP